MVEWLEWLGLVQKVAVKREFEAGDWKPLSVIPAVNGYLFRKREG